MELQDCNDLLRDKMLLLEEKVEKFELKSRRSSRQISELSFVECGARLSKNKSPRSSNSTNSAAGLRQLPNIVSSDAHKIDIQEKVPQIQNVEKEDFAGSHEKWTTVRNRRVQGQITASQVKKGVDNALLTINQGEHKPLKPRLQVGTGAGADAIKCVPFSGKKWLYIARISEEVTDSELLKYIQDKLSAKESEVVIKELTNKNKMKSFKLGISDKYYASVSDCSFWPAGVAFRDFNFRLPRQVIQNNKPNEYPQNFVEPPPPPTTG